VATTVKYIVQLETRNRIKEGLDAGARALREFTRNASRVALRAEPSAGAKFAADLLSGARSTFLQSTRRLSVDLAEGVINKEQFRAQSRIAAEVFNQ
jgi:hypothetical protein